MSRNRNGFNRGQQNQQTKQNQVADVWEDIPAVPTPMEPGVAKHEVIAIKDVGAEGAVGEQGPIGRGLSEHSTFYPQEDFIVRDEHGTEIGMRGATGTVGDPGPTGVADHIATYGVEDLTIDPSELEDEREDSPELDQDHEETETEDEDEIVEDEEEVVDPTTLFPYTEVTEWSVEQLEHYISRPEGMDVYHSKLVKAVEIHRQLYPTLDVAWSIDECTAFFKEGVTPAKTTTGCYVKDETRQLRREGSWTTQELEAWALGEIKPSGLVTTNGLAIELKSRFAMPINSVEPEMVIAHYKYHFGPGKGQVKLVGEQPVAKAVQPTPEEIPAIKEKIKYPGLTEMSQSYIEESLKRYVDAVQPNRVVAEKLRFEAQVQLDTLIHYILKQQDPAAVKSGLDILFTKIVEERITNERGVFSDTNAFRFVEGITELNKARETHRRLLTLFFAFVDGDEGVLAQTDVPELIKYLPAHHQNLLLAYLGRS